MKGQIFIMITVLILIAIFLFKNSIKPFIINPDDFLYENFLNLKNELIKTVDVSLLNDEVLRTNLNNFIDFSTEVFKQKGFTETITYDILVQENTTIVFLNISINTENSFIEDKFIINRTVFS